MISLTIAVYYFNLIIILCQSIAFDFALIYSDLIILLLFKIIRLINYKEKIDNL